jgi:hypothetical protein
MTGIVIPATAAAAVAAVIVAAVAIATVFPQRGASPGQITASHSGASPPLDNEAAVRNQAVTWILHQVSRAAVVACDAQVYADLTSRGFPGVNLLEFGSQSNDPLGADLVVSTAAVRAQFRDRLAVWAPAIIAAFGSGNARIEIRLEFPGGATAYRAVQQKYARARRATDAQLLTNNRITLSATAKTQLRSGKIDPRLPELIAAMVHFHPLQVVDFGGQSPGGGPASLLRSMDLATANPPAHLTPSAYINWMRSFIEVQRSQYHPALSLFRLSTGQTVLRIGYRAPSLLNPRAS